MLTITMKGGIIRDVLSDNENMRNYPIAIIDYDTDGTDVNDLDTLMDEECYVTVDNVKIGGPIFIASIDKIIENGPKSSY